MRRQLVLGAAALAVAAMLPMLGGIAQDASLQRQPSPSGLWLDVSEQTLSAPPAVRRIVGNQYRTVSLDRDVLFALLSRAPRELTPQANAGGVELDLPWPDGGIRRFRVEESPIMDPGLAAQFPELRTYRGQGIDDRTASLRFDSTPSGFHAMALSADGTV